MGRCIRPPKRQQSKFTLYHKYNYSNNSLQLALLAIIQRVGGIAALPFVPYLADGMGRRFAVFMGATIMVIGAILQACSHNVETFIGAR